MIEAARWISVKEAAALYGLNPEYFRRNFCQPGGGLELLRALRVRTGPAGRRRILVLETAVFALIEEEQGGVG
jgi:hypothetical protein